MHVFLLTDKKFDLRILPASTVQHMHYFRGNPAGMSQMGILKETRYLLDQLPTDINGGTKVIVAMEVNIQSMSAYSMLLIALSQVGIRPEIWLITEKQGVYLGLSDEASEAMDWYQTHFRKQLEKAEISKLENDGSNTKR